MKQITLGLDNGNKCYKSSEGYINESGYTKSDVEPISKQNLLIYEGKFYSIGGNRLSVQMDKTLNDDAFILSLPAIGDAIIKAGIKDEKVEVMLGTGLPIIHYGKLKSKFRDYFLRKDVCFNYKGQMFNIDIINCKVYPQGYAAFMQIYSAYKGVTANLFDIGGYTVDFFRIDNGIINPSTSYSIPNGVIILITSIQQELMKLNINLTDGQVEEIILGKEPFIFDIEVNQMVELKTQEYVDNLLSKILEMGFELRNACIFVGGGSLLLKKYIEATERIKYSEYLDNFSNSKGNKLLLEQELRR
jgi:plasmid segregation protein ParM